MEGLAEQRKGHPTPHRLVPIVPTAAIYDLAYKTIRVSPHENDAYQPVSLPPDLSGMGAPSSISLPLRHEMLKWMTYDDSNYFSSRLCPA